MLRVIKKANLYRGRKLKNCSLALSLIACAVGGASAQVYKADSTFEVSLTELNSDSEGIQAKQKPVWDLKRGRVYTLHQSRGVIRVDNIADRELIQEIDLGAQLLDIAVTPDAKGLWVLGGGEFPSVTVVNLDSLTVKHKIYLPLFGTQIAMRGSHAFITTASEPQLNLLVNIDKMLLESVVMDKRFMAFGVGPQ